MNHNIAYCEHCQEYVEPRIVQERETTELNGKKYEYLAEYGICPQCGHYATPNEISEKNQKSFLDEVRRSEKEIVSQGLIDCVPEIYNIGKRPLSELLGWGEHTYSRFLEGNIPNKENSDVIKRIAKSPLAYICILIQNKSSISDVAYRKSLKAALAVLASKENNKIEKVAGYILAKTGECSPLSLQKELYYAQALSFVFLDKPLFNNKCQAWVRGPVYADIWNDLGLVRADDQDLRSEELIESIKSSFSDEELEVLDAVVDHVACYSAGTLREFTHMESPWITTRGSLSDEEPSTEEIDQKLIQEYFEEIKTKYQMKNPDDIQKYMQDLFNKRKVQ